MPLDRVVWRAASAGRAVPDRARSTDQSLHRIGARRRPPVTDSARLVRGLRGREPRSLSERRTRLERCQPARPRKAHRISAVPGTSAAIGSPVQQTNCHPFRHGRWLFVHNGFLGGFHEMRRPVLAIEPSHFRGPPDRPTQRCCSLAITFGLEEDPIGAVERAVGLVEATAERHGIDDPVQMTLDSATAAGCGRSATQRSESQPVRLRRRKRSRAAPGKPAPSGARQRRPRGRIRSLLGDLPGAWLELPESTLLVIQAGTDEHLPFWPQRPT